MKQNNKTTASTKDIVCLALGCLLILLMWWLFDSISLCNDTQREMETAQPDTVRVVIHDTVTVVKPAPVQTNQLYGNIVRLPRWVAPDIDDGSKKQTDDPMPITPTEDLGCTLDSVDVVAPMERKVYTDSVNYRAVISGAWVSLDTMELYRQREVRTITKPPDRRRWSVGIGVGYGMTPHGLQPWAGITVNYTLFRF